jgi:hypothetical protein
MTERQKQRLSLILLVPFVLISVVGVFVVPWHAASSIDSRTHVEMIKGIHDHGLPYAYNGPLGRFPELQAAWNIVHDGKLWGTYPPLFPYIAAPFFALGGLRAVSAVSMGCMCLLAIASYLLGARYGKNPLLGTATAYVTLLSTPASTSTFDIGPYMLCITLFTFAAWCALGALEASGALATKLAGWAGFLGALSCAAHLLTFPMLAAMLLVLFVMPSDERGALVARPTAAAVRRGGWAAAGATVPLLALAVLNKMRFGSFNPVSYGPCVWRRCVETGLANQSAGAMLAYAAPVFAVLGAAVIGMYVARRSRPMQAAIAIVAVAVLWFAPGALHAHATGLATIAWGYIVDVSKIPMAPMVPAADGVGTFWGPYVIKSTLQSSPLFGLVLVAPFATAREKRATLALALPCLALYTLLAMRAVIPAVHALGFPWLYMRYAMPAWPLLAALAVGALRDVPWRRPHILAIVAVATLMGVVIGIGGEDLPVWRRVLILWGSLLLAVLGPLAVLMLRKNPASSVLQRATIAIAGAAFACGVGCACGIDLTATFAIRFHNDERVDAIARATPERLAIVGYAREIDIALTLKATRDLEYADLLETTDWTNFRQLIDLWSSDGRPIYALWPEQFQMKSPWPDVTFDLVDGEQQLFKVTKH